MGRHIFSYITLSTGKDYPIRCHNSPKTAIYLLKLLLVASPSSVHLKMKRGITHPLQYSSREGSSFRDGTFFRTECGMCHISILEASATFCPFRLTLESSIIVQNRYQRGKAIYLPVSTFYQYQGGDPTINKYKLDTQNRATGSIRT